LIKGLPFQQSPLQEEIDVDTALGLEAEMKNINPSITLQSIGTSVHPSYVIEALMKALQISFDLPAYAPPEWLSLNRKRPNNEKEFPKGWVIRQLINGISPIVVRLFGRTVRLASKWDCHVQFNLVQIPDGPSVNYGVTTDPYMSPRNDSTDEDSYSSQEDSKSTRQSKKQKLSVVT